MIFIVDGGIIFLDKLIDLISIHFLSLLYFLFYFIFHFFFGYGVLLLVTLFKDSFEMGVLLLNCIFLFEELVVFGFDELLLLVELLVSSY